MWKRIQSERLRRVEEERGKSIKVEEKKELC